MKFKIDSIKGMNSVSDMIFRLNGRYVRLDGGNNIPFKSKTSKKRGNNCTHVPLPVNVLHGSNPKW